MTRTITILSRYIIFIPDSHVRASLQSYTHKYGFVWLILTWLYCLWKLFLLFFQA